MIHKPFSAPRANRFSGIGVAALVAALISPATAQTFTYDGPSSSAGPPAVDGNWSTAANWVGDSLPTQGNGVTIILNSSQAAGFNINALGTAFTLNTLRFTSSVTPYRNVSLNGSFGNGSKLVFDAPTGGSASIISDFTGASAVNPTHSVNAQVDFNVPTTISAINSTIGASFGSTIAFGGPAGNGNARVFDTKGNTITAIGAAGSTVPGSQQTVSMAQTVTNTLGTNSNIVLVGGAGSTTNNVAGGTSALNVTANAALGAGKTVSVNLQSGVGTASGTTAGAGGGASVVFVGTSTFSPLVTFDNTVGNLNAAKIVTVNTGVSATVAGLSSAVQNVNYFVRAQTTGTATTASTLTINTVNAGDNFSYGGRITNGVPTLSLVKNGAGTQTFTGTTTANQLSYTGSTTVNAGTLAFATTTSNTLAGAMIVNNGGTLNVGSAASTTLTLSGAVTVNTGGTFNVLPNALVTGAVDVNGGTVGGTGTLPAFTLESSAVLAPGVVGVNGGLGTINAGGLVFDGGSTISFGLDQTTPSLSDRVALAGTFTKGTPGLYTFDFGSTNLTGANAFDLVTFTGTPAFAPGDFTLTGLTSDPGFNFNIEVTSSAVRLVSSAAAVVPESGTGLLAGLGLLAGIILPVIRRRTAR